MFNNYLKIINISNFLSSCGEDRKFFVVINPYRHFKTTNVGLMLGDKKYLKEIIYATSVI